MNGVSVRHLRQSVTFTSAGRIYGKGAWARLCNEHLGPTNQIAIYAFFDGDTLLYVGESENLADKTRGSGRKCHPWRKALAGHDLEVLAFSFPEPPDDVTSIATCENASNPFEVIRRAIEAEIVFALRSRTGKLPLEQHEIHFQPKLFDHEYVKKCVAEAVKQICPE